MNCALNMEDLISNSVSNKEISEELRLTSANQLTSGTFWF
jgi:hypothetical protein